MKIEKFKALFTLGTALKRFRRPSHAVGTGGVGEVQIVDNPKFPEHEFFRAGQYAHVYTVPDKNVNIVEADNYLDMLTLTILDVVYSGN